MTTKTDKAEETAAETAPLKAEETITMHFVGDPYSGELVIGVESFVVKDGAVNVPARLFAGAHQAGFR